MNTPTVRPWFRQTRIIPTILATVVLGGTLAAAPPVPPQAPQRTPRGGTAAPRLFKDRITPHWSVDNNRFWYRNDLRGGAKEFIVVDAERGVRAPAFDHAVVARKMGEGTDPARLPVTELRLEEKTVLLLGPTNTWEWNPATQELSEKSLEKPAVRNVARETRPRPSSRTGAETELTFENQLNEAVELFWIDPQNERQSYGKLAPGARQTQHTFAGHVWLVVNARGENVAVFEASEKRHPGGHRRRAGHGTPATRRPATGRPQSRARFPFRPISRRALDGVHPRSQRLPPIPRRRRDSVEQRWQGRAGLRALLLVAGFENVGCVSHRGERAQGGLPGRVVPPGRWPRETANPALRAARGQVPEARAESFRRRRAPPDQAVGRPLRARMAHAARAMDRRRETTGLLADGPRAPALSRDRGGSGDGRRAQPDRRKDADIPLERAHGVHERGDRDVGGSHRRNHLCLGEQRVAAPLPGRRPARRVEECRHDGRMGRARIGSRRRDQPPGVVSRERSFFGTGSLPDSLRAGEFRRTGLVWLTEGDGQHSLQFSPDRRFAIDTYSRVDRAPVHELRRTSDGRRVCPLDETDTSGLAPENAPEVFVAKGRDGNTDIWGVLWRPRDFDPARKYPVIEDIYAGPHGSFVPKTFSAGARYESLTKLGFIVAKIDGMGTANRSKAFHDVCWRNLKDAGFPDRILWHQAVAKKYLYYDITRVGIYGTSAGGQNAAAAVLFHPEFYRAAVANCGCHDNRLDKASWNEQWMGLMPEHRWWSKDGDNWYSQSSNIDQAHRLRGKLFLIVGELDQNVPPESTYRFCDALIKAGKDFEFLDVPGGGHGAGGAYGQRRLQDFFVRNLLGQEPPDRNRAQAEAAGR